MYKHYRSIFLFSDISFKNKSGDVPVYKRESMQLYHNVVSFNIVSLSCHLYSEVLKNYKK